LLAVFVWYVFFDVFGLALDKAVEETTSCCCQEIKNMNLQLYEAGEVISRKGGGKKHGARYANYSKAIGAHLDWLFEQIDASKDKTIRIKLADFAGATGFKMQKVTDGKVVEGTPGLNPTSLGWGFKYSLYHAGITYNMGKVEDGQPVMIMRRKVEGDMLPASLQEKKGAVAETEETAAEGEEEKA
jgi:hypothetical protein